MGKKLPLDVGGRDIISDPPATSCPLWATLDPRGNPLWANRWATLWGTLAPLGDPLGNPCGQPLGSTLTLTLLRTPQFDVGNPNFEAPSAPSAR